MTRDHISFAIGCLAYLTLSVLAGVTENESFHDMMAKLSAPGFYAILPGAFIAMLLTGESLDSPPLDRYRDLSELLSQLLWWGAIVANAVFYGLLVIALSYIGERFLKNSQ